MGVLEASLCAGILILIGLDLKISAMRWKKGIADLNPLVQYFVKQGQIIKASATLLSLNLSLLSLMVLTNHTPVLLPMFFGAKAAFATIQIRSLIENGEYLRKSKPR